MHIITILTAATVLIVQALAQSANTTATAAPTTATDLPGLASELPSCALPCMATAAHSVNCSAADFPCLCSKATQFATDITPCLLTGPCSRATQDVFNSAVDAICADLGSSSPSQLAAASSYVAGEVASQTAVQAGGSRAVPTGAPVAGLGLGVVGAAAALAALAL